MVFPLAITHGFSGESTVRFYGTGGIVPMGLKVNVALFHLQRQLAVAQLELNRELPC